jgi:hypothetical protein
VYFSLFLGRDLINIIGTQKSDEMKTSAGSQCHEQSEGGQVERQYTPTFL